MVMATTTLPVHRRPGSFLDSRIVIRRALTTAATDSPTTEIATIVIREVMAGRPCRENRGQMERMCLLKRRSVLRVAERFPTVD